MQSSAPSLDTPVLLEHGHVLTLDGVGTQGRLSVAVSDGVIAAVGPHRELRARFDTASRVSCRHRIIMPGLVNAHLHPELHVLKGALEQHGLHDWDATGFFNAAVDVLGTDAGRAIQRTAVRAALAECVLGGTTCVGTYGVSSGAEEACHTALAEFGLRGTITIRDDSFTREMPAATTFYRLHAEEALHAPELERAAAAHDRGARIVMHAAETQRRMAIVRERFGTTTIRLLDSYGLLSPRVLLSHAICVDAEEIGMIAARGAHVVVSPSAEMKLGDGLPPAEPMLRAGILVALGTDAAVCNNSSDMFLEMRALGQSQKLRYGPHVTPAEQILLMATRHGAAALGGAGSFGALREGMAADIIMIDTANPRMQPLVTDGAHSNLAANLVFAATSGDVSDVMVAGRFVVRRRRMPDMDTRVLWRDLGRAARALHRQTRE